jgi:hypothetical protein
MFNTMINPTITIFIILIFLYLDKFLMIKAKDKSLVGELIT